MFVGLRELELIVKVFMKKKTLLLILISTGVVVCILIVRAAFAAEAPIATCRVEPYAVAPAESGGILSALFDTSRWPARWNCGNWTPFHGWLYIISDVVIWLSYFAIPLILASVVFKYKRSLPFKKIFILFITFILACGLTHLIDAIIFFWPAYGVSALIRFFTAGMSLVTVFALTKVAPWAMEFKSPEELEKLIRQRTKELIEVNRKLRDEIRQRKRAEDEVSILSKSQQYFQQAIQDSSIVSMTDKQGTITYVNKNFETISGYTEMEMLGKDHRILNADFHENEFWRTLWETILAGRNWHAEIKNRAKDGSEFWLDTFIMPFANTEGEVLEFLSMSSDITARKIAEREILNINVGMEESVRARTQKLEAANKELEAFTYSVSHDLRAPLRAVDGYASILFEDYFDKLDDEGRKVLRIIMRNARKMGQLIDDLLEFSRFGRSSMRRVSVDMRNFVCQIAQE